MSCVVDVHLAARPVGEHGDERVMGVNAALTVVLDDVESGQCFNWFDDEASFFLELADHRLEDPLAKFLHAAGKAPFTNVRRTGPLHEEHPPVTAHDAENTDGGLVRVVPGHGARDSLSRRERVGL